MIIERTVDGRDALVIPLMADLTPAPDEASAQLIKIIFLDGSGDRFDLAPAAVAAPPPRKGIVRLR